MPPPVLTSALVVAGTQMALSRPTSGVSDAAGTVSQRTSQVLEQVESSQALYGPARTAIRGMLEMAEECREPDWNGYGAVPVLQEGLDRAAAFIRALTLDLPMPQPSIEPDGEVALEWLVARNRMLSVSFGEGERAAYAMVDGTDKLKGVVRVGPGSVPKVLRVLIEQIAG